MKWYKILLESYDVILWTMVQIEDGYGKIGHACSTSGKWTFYKNTFKSYSLTKTYLNIICDNDNNNDIKKAFVRFHR